MAKTRHEEFKIDGEEVLNKVKAIISEGNVRKVTVKDKEGNTVWEFSLTYGVIGLVLAPALVALGAVVAVIKECTIAIEREVETEEEV